MARGYAIGIKPLEILTEGQIEAMHQGIMRVLWKTGIRFESKKALKLFEKNGCRIDYDDMRVRIPPQLIEECLQKVPSNYHIVTRDPKDELIMGKNMQFFSSTTGKQIIDLDKWEPRPATRKELYDASRVLDALDNCDMLDYGIYFDVYGIPPTMTWLEAFVSRVRSSSKTSILGYSKGDEIWKIQIAKLLKHEPFCAMMAAPPLTFYEDAINAAFRFAEAGLPMFVVSGTAHGATGPATILGSEITYNAELLGGIVLIQLINPGTRVLVIHFSFPVEMHSGALAFGAIEGCLHHVAFNQLWRKYGVPTRPVNPGYTSPKIIDFQNGYEKALGALTAAISGANIIGLHGCVHGELAYHPVQSLLDNDIAGMIRRFMEGINFSSDTMALELIEKIGPIPGNYLNSAHTREWWRKEQFLPKNADRLTYERWKKTGKKSAIDYARDNLEEILISHKPTPLTSNQEEEIERILKEARNYYKEHNMISDDEWREYQKQISSPNYPYA